MFIFAVEVLSMVAVLVNDSIARDVSAAVTTQTRRPSLEPALTRRPAGFSLSYVAGRESASPERPRPDE